MPKHEMLKDFDAALQAEKVAMKRLGIGNGDTSERGALKAMTRLLDRIEALEAKLK